MAGHKYSSPANQIQTRRRTACAPLGALAAMAFCLPTAASCSSSSRIANAPGFHLVLAEVPRLVEERLALRLDDEPFSPRWRQRLWVPQGLARRDARRHQATDRRHRGDLRARQISRGERDVEFAPGQELV